MNINILDPPAALVKAASLPRLARSLSCRSQVRLAQRRLRVLPCSEMDDKWSVHTSATDLQDLTVPVGLSTIAILRLSMEA